jgi:hypothetical protein
MGEGRGGPLRLLDECLHRPDDAPTGASVGATDHSLLVDPAFYTYVHFPSKFNALRDNVMLSASAHKEIKYERSTSNPPTLLRAAVRGRCLRLLTHREPTMDVTLQDGTTAHVNLESIKEAQKELAKAMRPN